MLLLALNLLQTAVACQKGKVRHSCLCHCHHNVIVKGALIMECIVKSNALVDFDQYY